MKKALILGVTGQDGSYLAEVLLEKGYEVHGLVRKSATGNTRNIDHLINDPAVSGNTFHLHRGDLLDTTSISRVVSEVHPAEIYNEADQDHVSWSYDMVGYSSDITASAVGKVLEIIRQVDRRIRFFQPCTSNMFGQTGESVQNEQTEFNPQSPYAVAKVFAYHITRYYRTAFDMHASVGIMFNHESPRRPPEYVTRKISRSVARIALGLQSRLSLGDISARIDWGYSREYMDCAWRMLQQDQPGDYIVATGEAHSVEEFVEAAFGVVGLDPGDHVRIDSSLLRPTKTSTLVGDITRARKQLDWEPEVMFEDLVRMMVEADLEREEQNTVTAVQP